MASVSSAATDEKPPIDKRLEALGAIAAAAGKPIRVRIQPDIYDYQNQANQTWLGLIWMIELEDVEEGRKLREGLTWFFQKFGQSAESQKKLLAWLKNGKNGGGQGKRKAAPPVVGEGAGLEAAVGEAEAEPQS